MPMPNSKVIKIAVAGAIIAIAVDYFLRPTLNKELGL